MVQGQFTPTHKSPQEKDNKEQYYKRRISVEKALLQERDNKGFDCGEKKKKNKEARRDSYRRYNEKEREFFVPVP